MSNIKRRNRTGYLRNRLRSNLYLIYVLQSKWFQNVAEQSALFLALMDHNFLDRAVASTDTQHHPLSRRLSAAAEKSVSPGYGNYYQYAVYDVFSTDHV